MSNLRQNAQILQFRIRVAGKCAGIESSLSKPLNQTGSLFDAGPPEWGRSQANNRAPVVAPSYAEPFEELGVFRGDGRMRLVDNQTRRV